MYSIGSGISNTRNAGLLSKARRQFELKDHLGNVRVLVSDMKTITGEANVLGYYNYYPFGMPMPGGLVHDNNYRFGFNGQEKDDEINGTGNTYTAQFWEYDARIGRRWNLDPKPMTGISEYACFANSPIWYSDVLGDTVRLNGFHQKFILRNLRKGLDVSKTDNPYKFDSKGNLEYDKTKYDALSEQQKEVADNINSLIESPINFTIKKAKLSDIIPGTNGKTLQEAGGGICIGNIPNTGGSRADQTGNSGVTIYWNGKSPYFDQSTPAYVLLFHELGGHGFYGFHYKPMIRLQQGFSLIYENKVRALNHLDKRPFDDIRGHTAPLLMPQPRPSIFSIMQTVTNEQKIE